MGRTIFWQFFAGIPMEEMDIIPVVPLGKWMLPIGIFLLIAGSRMEKIRCNETLVCYRYGSRKRWWKNHFWKGIFYGILMAVVMLFVTAVLDMIFFPQENKLPGLFLAGGLWILHITSMLALFLWMDLQKIRRVIPAALLLLEGVTFLIGFRIRKIASAMFGMWGMYVQSSLYDKTYGFPTGGIIAIEVLLIAAGWLCGRIVLQRQKSE